MFRACAAALFAFGLTAPAAAGDPSATVERFAGDWLGTGQVLIGSQTGLKFHCELSGDPRQTQILTFSMSGRCWMGSLSAPVYAKLRYNEETGRFYGAFMDGAEGNGVDIVGTEAEGGVALQLSRGAIKGNLVAEAINGNQMRALLSIVDTFGNRELPVVAMGFARKEAAALGLPPYLPDVVTGSLETH